MNYELYVYAQFSSFLLYLEMTNTTRFIEKKIKGIAK